MSPVRLDQIERLYNDALARSPEERAAFLSEACGQDAELRAHVGSLFADEVPGDDLLESPASNLLDDLSVIPLAPAHAWSFRDAAV